VVATLTHRGTIPQADSAIHTKKVYRIAGIRFFIVYSYLLREGLLECAQFRG
jgi:hypothetical protein